MNYYEELGIRSDADEEEIRKAHRRLVKLMHPDHQRDQAQKQLAETQMRRLNSMVATLLDPEEREEYDDQLKNGGGEGQVNGQKQSTLRSIPWWIASTLGAVLLTVGAIWIWADHLNSGFHPVVVAPETSSETQPAAPPPAAQAKLPPPPVTRYIPHAEDTTTVVVPPAKKEEKTAVMEAPKPALPPAKPVEKPKVTEAVVRPPKVQVPPAVQPASTQKVPAQPAARQPVVKSAKSNPPVKAAPASQTPKVFDATLPPAQVSLPKSNVDNKLQAPGGPVEVASLPRDPYIGTATPNIPPPDIARTVLPTPSSHSHDPLEGEWVYAPTSPEKSGPNFFPPEFIKLRLTRASDGMQGQYSARYSVNERHKVSPDVNFVLKSVDKTARKYVWTSPDGSKGTLAIRSVETDIMRLEWHTTNLRGGPALMSGMATLIRTKPSTD